MILCFKLSMPSVGSWSGKWTGSERDYVIIHNFGRSQKATTKAKKILEKGYFRYNFGDGWTAAISVKEISPQESRTIKRKSNGFFGYDWMVGSILEDMTITPPSERQRLAQQRKILFRSFVNTKVT